MQAVTQAADLGEVGDDSVARRRYLLTPPFEQTDCIPSLGSVRAPKGVEGSFHGLIGVDTLLHKDLPATLQNLLGSPFDSDESNKFGDGGPGHSRKLQWKTWRRELTGSRRVRSCRYARRFSCWRSPRWREVCQKGHHGRKQLWAGSLTLNHAVQLLAELGDHWSTGGWSSSTVCGDGRGRGEGPRHVERRGRSGGCGHRLNCDRRLLLCARFGSRCWEDSNRGFAVSGRSVRMAIQALSFRSLSLGWWPVQAQARAE